MPRSEYKSPGRRLKENYAVVASTLALVVALTGAGAMASGLITGKQIKNGSITAKDIRKKSLNAKLLRKNSVTAQSLRTNAVTSKAIQAGAVGTEQINTGAVTTQQISNGTIKSADIGAGEVQPENITVPAPQQLVIGSAAAQVADEYAKVADIGTYNKQDSTSVLSVSWTGNANAPAQSCVFQIRVDGQPAPNMAGVVYVPNIGPESTTAVAATALFPGIGVGSHTIEVWAKAITGGAPTTDPCIIGAPVAGIPQTFVVSEELT